MRKFLKLVLMMLLLVALTNIQKSFCQEIMEPFPGVKMKVLTENEHVKVFEVTVVPGATADWHSHPQHTIYALTDISMKIEEKEKQPYIIELKKGESKWFPAVTHKISNSGKKSFIAIFTEIK